jgi:hypothetical protein
MYVENNVGMNRVLNEKLWGSIAQLLPVAIYYEENLV